MPSLNNLQSYFLCKDLRARALSLSTLVKKTEKKAVSWNYLFLVLLDFHVVKLLIWNLFETERV